MIKYLMQYNFDYPLFFQSTPSLIISLLGLLVTGQLLQQSIENKIMQKYPFLLQSNCMLSFKGNIELLYALYLSSMRENGYISYQKYLRYTIDNGYLVLLQSITIGVTIGIIGISKVILSGIFNVKIFLNVFVTSLVTCTVSTLVFIVFLFLTIELSKFLNINPDNVILPTVSSISDYLSIRLLITFTKYFEFTSRIFQILLIFICLCLIPVCLFLICLSKKRMPIQSMEVLFITYLLSTLGGYLLDNMSSKYSFMASTFPVYSGLAVSISFIYLHKIFSSINNNTEHNAKKSFFTLICTSFAMIVFYIFISSFLESKKSYFFYGLFLCFFIFQVFILLKFIERLALFLQAYDGDIGTISIPIITALGDLISTILLIFIALIVRL